MKPLFHVVPSNLERQRDNGVRKKKIQKDLVQSRVRAPVFLRSSAGMGYVSFPIANQSSFKRSFVCFRCLSYILLPIPLIMSVLFPHILLILLSSRLPLSGRCWWHSHQRPPTFKMRNYQFFVQSSHPQG